MGRKGREILLDRLVVADIGQHGIENRQLSAVRGYRQARLRHQGKQADGLESNRLTACVWAGNDQFAAGTLQLHRNWDNLAPFDLEIPLQQRMTSFVQKQPSLARRGPFDFAQARLLRAAVLTYSEDNRDAAIVFREAGFCKLQFQFRQDTGAGEDRIRIFSDTASHFQEDAVNLGLLFVQQANQFIVLLDGLQGLDENRLPAGTGPVHHSLNAPPLLNLDRNHETLAADRYQLFLNGAALRETAQVIAQRILDGALLFLNVASNTRQFRGGAIVQRAVRQDLAAKEPQKLSEVDNGRRKTGYGRPFCLHGHGRLHSDFPPLGGAIHDQHNIADFSCFQRRARDSRFVQEFADLK